MQEQALSLISHLLRSVCFWPETVSRPHLNLVSTYIYNKLLIAWASLNLKNHMDVLSCRLASIFLKVITCLCT